MPYCYQCDKEVAYLFGDSRGACCTRLTVEEVTGEHKMAAKDYVDEFEGMEEMQEVEYAVQVKFKYKDGWSRSYTYKSIKPYKKYDIVIVPTNDFYNIGKVFSCKEAEPSDFLPGIEYKYVITKLELE
jgi:hypothetical protein